MIRFERLLLATCFIAALAGCGRDHTEEKPKMDAAALAFQHEEDAWRLQRRDTLLKPDGWTSLVGLHWIDPGAHYVGSSADSGIRLSIGPAHLGMLELKGDAFHFVPDKAASLTLDGQPLTGSTTLRTDAVPDGPSVIGFDDGKGSATVIERSGRYALRVRHARLRAVVDVEQEQLAAVEAGRQDHALADAEAHLARREVRIT